MEETSTQGRINREWFVKTAKNKFPRKKSNNSRGRRTKKKQAKLEDKEREQIKLVTRGTVFIIIFYYDWTNSKHSRRENWKSHF